MDCGLLGKRQHGGKGREDMKKKMEIR